MQRIKKGLLKVVSLLILGWILYSCDFFAPYDLEFVGLSEEELNFGLFENEKQFIITYADSFDVNWDISPLPSGISISPMSGIININNPDTVTVKLDRSKFFKGNPSYKIEINFEGKTSTLKIDLLFEMRERIAVSTDSLNFGSLDSLSRFTLTNTGNLPLKWDFTPLNDWITVDPDTGMLAVDSSNYLFKSSGTNSITKNSDTTITVKIDNKKLNAGENFGLLQLKTEAGIDTIKVTAVKSAAPLLKVSPDKLDFGNEETQQIITIENIGSSQLNWSAESNAEWLTISPPSGNTTINSNKISFNVTSVSNLSKANTSQVEVNVNRTGLLPGNYSSSININSNGGSAVVEVSMRVPEIPVLEISETVLNFGNFDIMKRIRVSNSGTGKLSWNVSASESWITVFPLNDSTTSGDKEIIISVTRIGLLPGSYSGNINIASNGGEKSILITMLIDELPQLEYGPASLDFGLTNTSLEFELHNSGGGELNWNLSSEESWLLFAPSSGTTTTETEKVNVTINRIGLIAGSYNGSIKIESNAGSGNINVGMSIAEMPMLSFTPGSINFGEKDSAASIEIRNIGDGNLNWEISADQPWIMLENLNGSLSANQKNDINVKIKRAGLSPGEYSGNINISSNGGSGTVNVQLTVSENPKLSYNPHAINFGEKDSVETFRIKNVGDGNLEWKLSADQPWIDLSNTNGSITNEEVEIEVKINRNNLTEGDYTGNITITSNGGDGTISVSLKVKDEPELSLSTNSLDFKDDKNALSFKIFNKGKGTLTWNIEGNNESWLHINPSNGSVTNGQTTVDVSIDRNLLSFGEHSTAININSNGGNETVEIKVEILNNPDIKVSKKNINLDSSELAASFVIENMGTGLLEWTAEITYDSESTVPNWLSITPRSGSTLSTQTIIVNANPAGLLAGNHFADINIKSNGGGETIKVKLQVHNPILEVSANEIDFGDNSNSGSFILQNTGTGAINWSSEIMYVDGGEGWLQMTPTSGNFGSSKTINLSVDRTDLSEGSHTADIQIYSNGGNKTIHLYLQVEPPHLSVSALNLDFGNDLTELTFNITNTGGGELEWEITTGMYDTWLNVEPTRGTTTTEEDIITVTVSRFLGSSSNTLNKNNGTQGIGTTGHIYVTGGDIEKTINVYVLFGSGDE